LIKQAGELWIIQNQLGKRNLSPRLKKYLIGQEYSLKKNTHGGKREPSVKNTHLSTTAKRLGEVYKLNESTIRQYEREYQIINYLPEDLRMKFLGHKNNLLNSKKITYLSKASEKDQEILLLLQKGEVEEALRMAEWILEESEPVNEYKYGQDPEVIAEHLIDLYPRAKLIEVIYQLSVRLAIEEHHIKLPWQDHMFITSSSNKTNG